MPAPERGLVFTGARARFLINGTRIGWATNVNGGEEIQFDPAEVIDNIEVQEFIPVAYRANLSASRIKIVGKTFRSQGFFPSGGANAEERLSNIFLKLIHAEPSKAYRERKPRVARKPSDENGSNPALTTDSASGGAPAP